MTITLQDSSERVQQEDGSSPAALLLRSCTGLDTVYTLQTVSEAWGPDAVVYATGLAARLCHHGSC